MCGEKIWLYLLTFFTFLLYTCSIFCSLTYSTLSLNTTYLSFSPMEAIRLKYVLPSLSAAMLHIEICSCWRDINFSPLQGISCCCFASSFLSMRKVRCADMYIDMQCSFCNDNNKSQMPRKWIKKIWRKMVLCQHHHAPLTSHLAK